ncbi:MAG: hypothetical protein JRI68_11750 [Deltaproteobacteria bacterium]|nr:hypothetical protein [Deltaproteobacteria bacterium]
MESPRLLIRSWRAFFLGVGLLTLLTWPDARAQDEPTPKVTVKGPIKGGKTLLNPVWSEAADPKNHRYTVRVPSPTVSQSAKRLTSYLPKELCIVALSAGKAAPKSQPIPIYVSGGRTTPATLVVAEGQNVQFVNADPFPHKLYDVDQKKGGLGAEETKPAGQRIWKPPAVGVFEIKDEYFPSIRAWIVVEPKAAGVGRPSTIKPSEYTVPDLDPGPYQLQGYFMGEKVGKPLTIEVRPAPALQPQMQPLVVGVPTKKKKGG